MKGIQTYFFQKRKPKVVDALKKVRLFRGLTEKQVKTLAKNSYLRRYKDEELVFYKNEPAYGLFIVLKGSVEIREGKKLLVTYRPYNSFGEFAMLRDATRAADAITKGETVLCYLFKEDLNSLFLKDPKMCIKMYQNLLEAALLTLKNKEWDEDIKG